MAVSSRSAKLQLKSPFELAARGTLAHPVWLVASLILAIGVGAGAVWKLGDTTHTYQGKLLYSPNRITEPFYVAPDLQNLSTAIVTPQFFDKIRERNKVDVDLGLFRKKLRFELVGDATMDVFYSDKDTERGEDVCKDAMQTFIETQKVLRSTALNQFISEFKYDFNSHNASLADLRLSLHSLLSEYGLSSENALTAEIEASRRAISDYEGLLEVAISTRDLSRLQVESLAAIDATKNEKKSPSAAGQDSTSRPPSPGATKLTSQLASSEDAVDPQSVDDVAVDDDPAASDAKDDGDVQQANFAPANSDPTAMASVDLQLQSLLQAQIVKEKEARNFEILFAKKLRDYERAKDGLKRGLISQAMYEEAEADLDLLRAQRSQRVNSLESQLSTVTGRLNDRFTDIDPKALLSGQISGLNLFGNPSRSNELQTLAMLRGSQQAAEMRVEYLETAMAERHKLLDSLTVLQKQAEPILSEVAAEAEAMNLARINAERFEQTQRSDASPLSIVQAAGPAIDGKLTNHSKLFSAGFVATLAGLIMPLFLMNLAQSWRDKPETGTMLGLPVISRMLSNRQTQRHPADAKQRSQLAAIRVLNSFGLDRGVLTVATPSSDLLSHDLASEVAQKLIADGSTVQMISTAGSIDDPTKLDLTGRPIQSLSIKRQIDRARAENDFVVVSVPMIDDPVGLEAVATQSDAVVIVADASMSPVKSQKSIAALHQLGVRLLGVVTR